MKNQFFALLVTTAFLIPFAGTMGIARAAEAPEGLIVVGSGSAPGDGSGNCGYGEGDPFLRQAEEAAVRNAAERCAPRNATRISDFEVSHRCGPRQAYLSVNVRASFRCE